VLFVSTEPAASTAAHEVLRAMSSMPVSGDVFVGDGGGRRDRRQGAVEQISFDGVAHGIGHAEKTRPYEAVAG
jgi:hypothetical protein